MDVVINMKLQSIYCVIMGDIIDSRTLANRREVQRKLDEVLSNVNAKYSSGISAKFMISQGDEFQGLLETTTNIMDIIYDIQTFMFPVKLRFGIGMGEVWTDIDKDKSVRVDGPVYVCAREAINEVKNSEGKNDFPKTNLIIRFQENLKQDSSLLNTVFSLMAMVRDQWTERQLTVINCYRNNNENQISAAKAMDISQSAVNQHLKKAHYQSYRMAEETVQKELDQIWRNAIHEATNSSVLSGTSVG